MRVRLVASLVLASSFSACSSEEARDSGAGSWTPGTVYATPRAPNARGFLDRRGLIHAHSVHSHDACDGAPKDASGKPDSKCLEDFRVGLCKSRHDFVMLTDHDDSFGSTEFPDTLLFEQGKGDVLLERDGAPVANWLACPDGSTPLVMAGTESGFMPVGIERHVATTPSERGAVYGAETPEAIAQLKALGAVVLLQHTENWSVEQLGELPIDGFEMYNLHANTFRGAGAAMTLIQRLGYPELLPHPDLVLLPIVSEDPDYLGRWGSVLAAGKRRVTTMGTDCHRNTFPDLLPDGERIDSYRRMMGWFSNHLLVAPNAQRAFGDLELKAALRAGRLYGAFEVLGFPLGFDYYAEAGGGVSEMGGEALAKDSPLLRASMPTAEGGFGARPPELVLRLLRAQPGGWELLHETAGDLAHPVSEPGAYRVEVRMKPRHLVRHLASYAELGQKDFVWLYSNPIYVK